MTRAAPILTARLTLRGWAEEDATPFAALNADGQVMRYLGGPQSRAESDAAIGRMQALDPQGLPFFRAVERRSDGAFLGFVGVKPITFAAPFADRVEIGWRLARHAWGSGYATEAASALLDLAWRQGADSIVAFTAVDNMPSQAVMARLGMARVADGDFDHPALPAGHPLRRHRLFRIVRPPRDDTRP